ncbi:MAG: hypothetical protein V9G10_13730 [Candidatus Nanopelagicales bacterium]
MTSSVSFMRRDYTYLTQFRAGADLPCLARRPLGGGPVEVLVDLDAVAAQEGSSYAEFGLTEPGPDDRLLAWSVDLTGAELYSLRFRDLVDRPGPAGPGGTDLLQRRVECRRHAVSSTS